MRSACSSAGASGPFVLSSVGPTVQISAVDWAVHPARIPALSASAIYTGWWDGYQGGDKYKDYDKDHHHHEPTPEPSTLLSFGAALLIGGAVLYSRRLRRNRK